jgi:hypothetical protein
LNRIRSSAQASYSTQAHLRKAGVTSVISLQSGQALGRCPTRTFNTDIEVRMAAHFDVVD